MLALYRASTGFDVVIMGLQQLHRLSPLFPVVNRLCGSQNGLTKLPQTTFHPPRTEILQIMQLYEDEVHFLCVCPVYNNLRNEHKLLGSQNCVAKLLQSYIGLNGLCGSQLKYLPSSI